MSNLPPFPPNGGGYSPANPYGDKPPFPPPNPAYSYSAPSTSAPAYRPYDYSTSPVYPYPQSRPFGDSYDPYAPSASAYDPNAAQYRPPLTFAVPPKPPAAVAQSVPPHRVDGGGPDLNLITAPTTVEAFGHSAVVHSLPASHLPITKLVSMNPDDALELHRHLASKNPTAWYADGSCRAGEAWSSAVEYIMETSRSDKKMRGFQFEADGLDAELGGLYKAAEGFQELLQHSIKYATPISHELIVFCDSAAAIVALDTSSRRESLRFDALWRQICTEFLDVHLTLVWIPKGSGIEGANLANKIATVGASNSYLKRKKEQTLPEPYRRHRGGEPAPSGSSEAGPWQRGDADPSVTKNPFIRPTAVKASSPPPSNEPGLSDRSAAEEGEAVQVVEGSIFVTNIPDPASAKDIGILFAQFGDIDAVDIYHITPQHPRFAFVVYKDIASSHAAIRDLHRRPINLETPFAKQNEADLQVWRDWQGQLTVVMAEPPRLIPISLAADFPNLPGWAAASQSTPANDGRKRDREVEAVKLSSPVSAVDSPSPHKRTRQISPSENGSGHTQIANGPSSMPDRGSVHPTPPLAISLASPANLPLTPHTAERPAIKQEGKPPLTNSASEPQEYPIKVSAKTYRLLVQLVQSSFGKVENSNWIAHTCFVASEIDQARRALKDDLYATDGAFLTGRDLEQELAGRGFTALRVDSFITKVLKVLDGIAAAEQVDEEDGVSREDGEEVAEQLDRELSAYPDQTREAVLSAATMLEYLVRGKEAQEKKRLELERRVRVLEGMVKIGEVVGGVVRFLLSEDSK